MYRYEFLYSVPQGNHFVSVTAYGIAPDRSSAQLYAEQWIRQVYGPVYSLTSQGSCSRIS
jgi:hypothetical protein